MLAKEKFALDREAADWKRLVELVEPTLADFYRAQDAIRLARTPGPLSGEGRTRMRDENETDGEAWNRDVLYLPIERLNRESELFSRLAASRYRFQANFGVKAPFEELREVRADIILAVQGLMREQHRGLRSEESHDRWEVIVGLGVSAQPPRSDSARIAESMNG